MPESFVGKSCLSLERQLFSLQQVDEMYKNQGTKMKFI